MVSHHSHLPTSSDCGEIRLHMQEARLQYAGDVTGRRSRDIQRKDGDLIEQSINLARC